MSDPVCDPALLGLLRAAGAKSDAPNFAALGLTLDGLVQLGDAALVQQLIDAGVTFPGNQVAILQHTRLARVRPASKAPKAKRLKAAPPLCDHPLGWFLMGQGIACQENVTDLRRWARTFCSKYVFSLEDTCRLRGSCRLAAQAFGPIVTKWTLTGGRQCHACHSNSRAIAGDWRCVDCCISEGRLLLSEQLPPATLTALVNDFGQVEIRRQGILWSQIRATPGATEFIEQALNAVRDSLRAPHPEGSGIPKQNPLFPHHHFIL